jgi:hypothetical protein
MKIGFSILSHEETGPMLVNLLNQLNKYPDKEIVIHHDFYQADFKKDLLEGVSYELVKNFVRTYWSHTNNIHAILETFKSLYNKKCEWYITLSANCYPIKSSAEVVGFLKGTEKDGFIEHNNVLTDHFDFYRYFRKGFETKYLFQIPFINKKGKFKYRTLRKSRAVNERVLGTLYIPYHGSDWFMVNRDVMNYILSNEKRIKEIVAFLEDVNKGSDINVCPPEIVFQTLLANSNLFNLDKNNYRFINWTDSKNWHPNILTDADFKSIKASSALFARKFVWERSKEVIALIDREILM